MYIHPTKTNLPVGRGKKTKKMKKIYLLTLVLFSIILSSCSKDDNGNTANAPFLGTWYSVHEVEYWIDEAGKHQDYYSDVIEYSDRDEFTFTSDGKVIVVEYDEGEILESTTGSYKWNAKSQTITLVASTRTQTLTLKSLTDDEMILSESFKNDMDIEYFEITFKRK